MIFGLEEPNQYSVFQPMERLPSSSGDVRRAQADAERITTNSLDTVRRNATYTLFSELAAAAGGETAEVWSRANIRPDVNPVDWVGPRILQGARAALHNDPDAAQWPLDPEAVEAEINRRMRRDLDEARDAQAYGAAGSWLPQLVGSLQAGLQDPVTALTLPLGAGAGGIGRVVLAEAGLGFLGEAATLPQQEAQADRLGIEGPDWGAQLTFATVLSGVLGGVVDGVPRVLSYGIDRYRDRPEPRPAGVTPIQHERRVDAAGRDLDAIDMGRPVAGAPGGPDVALPPGAPANWPQIRNGIFAGESGGDYDALFGYSNRVGGQFEGVRLTEMTVDEAIAFSDPSGPYAQWVRGQVGRIATPMGAYQIVGRTLRAAKEALGLSGDEVMTRALQDRLGVWILNTQGTGAWEGYRGPRDSFTPPSGGAAAPVRGSGGDGTTRGYTGDGQLRYGDDERIDITYEVVDARQLQQARGDLQPRDRGHVRSDLWVNQTAAGLDPALIMFSPTADRGAPVVGPDNIIESGNGRVQAIRRAYAAFPDRGQAYRAEIQRAGFAIPEGVAEPVLVARRQTPFTPERRRDFVVKAQDSGVAQMTATERARVGRAALTADAMALLKPGARLSDPGNRDFARRFVAAWPASQQGQMIATDKGLSTDGIRLLRDAMFARAWDDAEILRRHIEEDAGELKTLLDALSGAAPDMARLRALIEAGEVRADMDITPFVLDAVRLIMTGRDVAAHEGKQAAGVIEELLADIDLWGNAVAPLTQALVRKFMPAGRQAPADTIAAFLSRYAREAAQAGRTGDAFAEAAGPLDVLRGIDRDSFGALTETGAVRVAPMRPAETDQQMLAGFDDGATGAAATVADDLILADLRSDIEGPGVTASLRPSGRGAEADAPAAGEPDARQPDTGVDALRNEFGDFEFKVGDVTYRPADMIDDIEAGDDLAAAIQACTMRGA